MNSECKNYPMKEFRAIFLISSILVIRSGYARKDHFSILPVIKNIWDLHKFGLQIWIQNAKITLWKNFGQFFWFHRFWSSGPGMQKKYNFSILAVIQNIWDLHKFGLQIWIRKRKNYPMKGFWPIFPNSSVLVIRSGYAKKGQFSILAVFQNVWDLHKFGLQIWIQNAKITLWKNFGQFFRFHQFWSSGQFSILAVIQNVWDLPKFGLQIWIQNAKITLWKNFGQFFRFHRFWSSDPSMQKKHNFSILAVIQNIWDLHKFELQVWIHNAKITLIKNFRQFFRFHHFWSSCEKISFLNISCISKCMGFT